MTDAPDPADAPVGMVDSLADQRGGPTEEGLAFARAYLAEGDMDPAILAMMADADRRADLEKLKAEQRARDWPALAHYRNANAELVGQKVDAVFMGDSITEMWRIAQPDLFSGGVVNRGISGQTSAQMLVRFMADVVALRPHAVHLMCGINDVAGNTGPTTPADYQNNILAMLDLARMNGIAVVLCMLTPINGFAWAPQVRDPRSRVAELNAWLTSVAGARGLTTVDYGRALGDAEGGLRAEFTRDGVHPGARGYAVMRPLAERGLGAVLGDGWRTA